MYSTRKHCPISIHAPAKGATQRRYDAVRAAISISIHAPAKGATQLIRCRRVPALNFNPRSREGSDYFQTRLTAKSIHFNPRSREGSDVGSPQGNRYTRISIHAPAKGATLSCKAIIAHRYTISIHAPAKGATYVDAKDYEDGEFQSTLPRRERLSCSHSANFFTRSFQSTLPRRERHRDRRGDRRIYGDFNPRSREGSDAYKWLTPKEQAISIHAPAKGATDALPAAVLHLGEFQSTLPRRERLFGS